jgi:hypothetical protein
MATKKNTATTQNADIVEILEVSQGKIECCILGSTPLILNRMSEKAKHELLLPRGRKTVAERATTLKHIPIEEYRASAYRFSDESRPTYLGVLSTAFKGALRTAALDLPGARKAQVGRLTYVEGDYVGIYGVPQLFMSITRSADMNKTPDVRTRAIVPKWACRLTISYVQPLMRPQAVANLLAAAGLTIGVGDWRPEKGAGNYGQFSIVDKDDASFLDILSTGGRDAQKAALDAPTCYDDETADLLSWFDTELQRRQLKGIA